MDQKRLFAAIALSILIVLGFELWKRETTPAPQPAPAVASQQTTPGANAPAVTPASPGSADAAQAAATNRPAPERLKIDSPRLAGSLNLRGARLDDLVLKDYHETTDKLSPNVRLFAPRDEANPYYAQWGWSAADGRTRVPDNETDWTVQGGPLAPGKPVTLSWDNGQGQTFQIVLSLDENYMFQADQRVVNNSAEPVSVLPWARVRRETTPYVAGFYILHEGFVGVLGGRLHETTYKSAKDAGPEKRGIALEQETNGGWAGFTDKYWLAAINPVDVAQPMKVTWRHLSGDGWENRWQVDFAPPAAQQIAAGATGALGTRVFAGAKEVHLLDRYQDTLHITDFDKAIDFGMFYFLTKPFFYALDWLFKLFGNFGIAILVFTVALKALFFPLASKAYKSMARMKMLAPKMTEVRERYKDDPAKAQAEMMALYKTEKVNPASGCLPILIQIPVFFALYKVLFVTIEMRHAPFFGWIHDLSAPDPTNLFTLFGMIPWDPPAMLHMPVWAIIMGCTMFLQQKMNPQPPDPIQAKIFTWMPVIFTFMLASFPAGLVIYWSWNNLLSVAQQGWISRHERAEQAQAKKLAKAKR
ncbi:membrane protein insertase YidC [Pseudoroseomonas wenyumeiae]|uniref:Membrane protein insertase YidC n=1 Tax=Teichococcus wenyumeiae TaxID=2478470 RepID=A0A3A9JJ37_9PROT|nr:membrane protein insertase YidC [Pseudoroseomonas wenyumeiae]RKK05271.1 membrane protein insertase YidC [Pseudoroseomonas wenyumeiae]RMI26068.1 membrane protein insertase YidC [Pseudoroseomonas wenyumeiae]